MDHSNDENNNTTARLRQQPQSEQNDDIAAMDHNHPSIQTSNIYLVSVSNDDQNDHRMTNHGIQQRHANRRRPRPQHISETGTSNSVPSHDNQQQADNLVWQQSYCSAPTDEEEASYMNRMTNPYNTTTMSTSSLRFRNDIRGTENAISALNYYTTTPSMGTTASNPIILHHGSDLPLPNDTFDKKTSYNKSTIHDDDDYGTSCNVVPSSNAPPQQQEPQINDHHSYHDIVDHGLGQNDDTATSSSSGGRLWRLAGEVAAGRVSLLRTNHNSNVVGPVRQIKDTLLEGMRSRADTDALCGTSSQCMSTTNNTQSTPTRIVRLPMILSSSSLSIPQSDEGVYREDEAFLINTGLAQKRVQVAQLMLIGLFGILLPWMGNLFVSSSCYFASVNVIVGSNGDTFPLHFGLWNYTPVSSALNGYKYCYPYFHSSNINTNDDDDSSSKQQYPSDAPILSRLFNVAALLVGTYSLVILWWYLISSRVRRPFWKAAVYAAMFAGLFQLATIFFFFVGRTCRSHTCVFGPGTALSAATAVAWMIFGAELHYHCPIVDGHISNNNDDPNEAHDHMITSRYDSTDSKTGSQSEIVVSQLEMSDIASASQQYFYRFYPCQNQQKYIPPNLS